MPRQYHQGKYEVKNREKYKGDPDKVTFLSSYEKQFFEWCDRSPSVILWTSENVIVPYHDPVKNKKRRYIVDLWMRYLSKDGSTKEALIEIKPHSQCTPPKRGNKRTKTYDAEMLTYLTNQAKWAAATEYARERGWDFRLITENQIFR